MREIANVQARTGLEVIADDPLLNALVGFVGEGCLEQMSAPEESWFQVKLKQTMVV
jgi:hypothetical protein